MIPWPGGPICSVEHVMFSRCCCLCKTTSTQLTLARYDRSRHKGALAACISSVITFLWSIRPKVETRVEDSLAVQPFQESTRGERPCLILYACPHFAKADSIYRAMAGALSHSHGSNAQTPALYMQYEWPLSCANVSCCMAALCPPTS